MGQPQRYLIDSNAVIDYLGEKLPRSGIIFLTQVIDTFPQVSVISKIEVLGYNAKKDSGLLLENFIQDVLVIGLTDEIVNQTIRIRKAYRIKLPDAIIAATALVYDLTLVTRNAPDFKKVSALQVIDPWSL